MGVDFWAGILIGFGLSIFFWFVTTQVLVARINVVSGLSESYDREAGYSYAFLLRNEGQRDAMDITVRCTLYSQGWATDEPTTIALIDLPVSQNGSIDIMEGRHPVRSRLHGGRPSGTYTYDRRISFRPEGITEFQKRKLRGDQYADLRSRLKDNQVPLSELMALLSGSSVNIYLLAFDRLSGARNISNGHRFQLEDITHPQNAF